MFNVQSKVFEEWLAARETNGKEGENALPKVFCFFAQCFYFCFTSNWWLLLFFLYLYSCATPV